MKREYLDSTDRRIAKLLSNDAQPGVNQLADMLQLSPPTVRSRLRALIDRNVLKIVGLLNLSERPELISAIVGINANSQGHLDELSQKIGALPFVTSVSIVTGRFDLMVEVLVAGDVESINSPFRLSAARRSTPEGVIERRSAIGRYKFPAVISPNEL